MNILDESTKAMLNAGQVAVLDGRYIVVTPETLFYVMQDAALETLDDIMTEQAVDEEANDSFIDQGCQCHFCGKKSDFTEYTLTISGGYASEHDLEQVTVDVCGECLEKMLAAAN